MLKLYTVIHPMEPDNPWNKTSGWRWAIHTDIRFDQWQSGCIYAMQHESKDVAEADLSVVVLCIKRALFAAGVECEVVAHVLTDCPLNPNLVDELAQLL